MRVAILLGLRSQCSRAQVGAVIVTSDNRVDSCSYNGPVGGLNLDGPCSAWCVRAMINDQSPDYSTCSAIHAEANALLRANHERIQGGTIYVTHAMCVNCARLIANSGIVRVVHRVNETDEHRNPVAVEALLRSSGIRVDRALDS